MQAADLPGIDEERAAHALIAAAGKVLHGKHREAPEGFVGALLSRAVPEDLMRYDARELADLATDAWSFLAERKPGAPKVRLESPAVRAEHERLRTTSVLDIVNDDMPFLVDSVLGELAERGVDIRLVVHPVFAVERDGAGHLVSFQGTGPATGGALRESFIHVHVERIDDEARRAEIVRAIADLLGDARAAVQDWRAMKARVGEVIAELKANPPPLPVGEIAEAVQFLEWLIADNFTFLGIRNYQFSAGGDALEPIFATGLGIMRARGVVQRWDAPLEITPEIRALLEEPTLLIVTKSSIRSRVHRRGYMDYVGVKRFDADGRLIGEFRIIGLFTSTAYTRSTRSIPYLRRKVEAVVSRAGFDLDGHSGKALINVLENYPRDELFQIDEDTLHNFALTVLQLDERPRVRVLPRRDRFDRFVSVLVYVPRDRFRQRHPQADRRLSRRRLQGPRQRLPSVLSRGTAGPRPLHHRESGRRGVAAGSRQPRARRRGDRADLDRRVRRRAGAGLRPGQGASPARALS
jgi:glutamate dehydrogenase